MADIQNTRRKGLETWKDAYESVEKTTDSLQKLNEEFAGFVADYNKFSDSRELRLLDYLDSLGDISEHWEEVNKWIDQNSTELDQYAGSLSNIRDIFKSITNLVGGNRRQIADGYSLARKIESLAQDAVTVMHQEGGLSDNILKRHVRKSQALADQLKLRTQALAPEANLARLSQEDLRILEDKRRAQEKLLRSAEKELRETQELGNFSGKRELIRSLEEEIKLRQLNIEYLGIENIKASNSLKDQLEHRKELWRAQRAGEGENGRSVRPVNIAAKLLGKVGLVDQASDLKESYNEWVTDRVSAIEKVEEAERALAEARKQYTLDVTDLGVSKKTVQASIDNLDTIRQRLLADRADLVLELEISDNADEVQERINRLNSSLQGVEEQLTQRNAELDKFEDRKKALETPVKQAEQRVKEAKEEKTELFKKPFELVSQIREALGDIKGTLITLAGILAVAMFRQLLKFDEEAVKTKRVIGQWADASALANTKFVTGTEVLKTMRDLGEQFHINPVQVFSSEELGRIAQAQKLTGMTSQAAGNLAVQSKITGKNANTYRDEIAKGANQANRLNHSAVNLSAVQNDVLNTSRAIALSYGKNTEGLARAAGAAAALGMNLQDVENISKNLMNFESSIEAEMQAQLLTGMQLNLAKAREYALNNDLEGVTREIGRQGMDAAKFSHMNYIQQENMAKALGMSREQMSKMLIMQEINRGLTAEQVAAMTGMRRQDIEALSAQEKWQTMKQRFLESLVPLLEPILQVTSDVLRLVSPLVGFIGKIAGWISRIINIIPENNVVLRTLWTLALGIGTVITFNWLRGLRGAALLGTRLGGIFKGIGTGVINVGKGIGNWITKLRGASTASQTLNTAGMVRGRAGRMHSPEVVARARNIRNLRNTPAPTPAAATGTSRLGGAFSNLGKNMGTILKGAAAMLIIAGALWVGAKACKEFATVEWKDMGKAGVVLVALAGAAWAAGKLLSKVAPEIIIASVALAAFGAALIPVAFALKLAAPAFDAFANVVVALGTAIKSAFEGIATIITATFTGLGTLLENITLEKAAALVAVGGGFGILGAGLLAGTTGLLLFPVGKFTRLALGLTLMSQATGLGQVASDLMLLGTALGSVAENLNKINLLKFTAVTAVGTLGNLGNAVASRIARPQETSIPKAEEKSRESQGIRKETIEAAAQSITIKEAQVHASAQQISVEQKATDLSKIEQKIDRVIKAVVDSRPDWNWLEFNRTYEVNT